jgi:hypothetical protein
MSSALESICQYMQDMGLGALASKGTGYNPTFIGKEIVKCKKDSYPYYSSDYLHLIRFIGMGKILEYKR